MKKGELILPTQAIRSLLDRELVMVAAKDLIGTASPLLQEMVNFSTNSFEQCKLCTSGNIDEDISVLILFLHIIEMTDAIEILISQSCPAPAQLLLRSSFEALLSLEYILEDESEYAQRSLSWLVHYVHTRLESYRSFSPSATKQKSLYQALQKHKSKAVRSIKLPDVTKLITNLERFLAKDHIRPIEEEFQARSQPKYWHSLFNGPSNIRKLAEHLGKEVDYLLLYKKWSTISHANDLSRFLTMPKEIGSGFAPFREAGQIRELEKSQHTLFVLFMRLTKRCSENFNLN